MLTQGDLDLAFLSEVQDVSSQESQGAHFGSSWDLQQLRQLEGKSWVGLWDAFPLSAFRIASGTRKQRQKSTGISHSGKESAVCTPQGWTLVSTGKYFPRVYTRRSLFHVGTAFIHCFSVTVIKHSEQSNLQKT